MAAAYLRRLDRYDAERRCIYGIKEIYCSRYMQYIKQHREIKPVSEFSRCVFSRCNSCPEYSKRIERGKKDKAYNITSSTYRKMADSAVKLWHITDVKLLFFTLTFPPFKKQTDVKELNKYFSKFMENLRRRKKYRCRGYIAVREGNGDTLRHHFHVVCAIPYTPLKELNDYWCRVISGICYYSPNAVTTDRKSGRVVKSRERVVKYLCKYFAKARKEKRTDVTAKTVFISRNTLCKPAEPRYSFMPIIKSMKGVYIITEEYFTKYIITCEKSYQILLDTVLTDLFNLPNIRAGDLYLPV